MLWRSSWWLPEQNYHSLMLWVLVGGRPGWFLVNLTQSRIISERHFIWENAFIKLASVEICAAFSQLVIDVGRSIPWWVAVHFWESRLNKSWRSSILPWSLHQPFPLYRLFSFLVEFLPQLPSVMEYDVRLKNLNKNVFSLSCFLSWSFITAIEMLARIKIGTGFMWQT